MSPEFATATKPARSGLFVAIVGPSGSGKDTLMSRAARHDALSPRVRFVRRTVTRAALIASEDHDSLDEAAFAHAEADGAFSLCWAAHGLRYGLPRSVHAELASGLMVVANLSRRSLADAVGAFGTLHVIELTAPADVLMQRILARGRESQDEIRDRLRRSALLTLPPDAAGHQRIDTSDDVETTTGTFVRHLNRLASLVDGDVNLP